MRTRTDAHDVPADPVARDELAADIEMLQHDANADPEAGLDAVFVAEVTGADLYPDHAVTRRQS